MKTIPGSLEYSIKLKKEVADPYGKKVVLKKEVRGNKFIYLHRWTIAHDGKSVVIKDYIDKPKPFNKVLITYSNGSTDIADSMTATSEKVGLQRITISKYIKTGKQIKGMTFRTLEQ